MLDEATSALDGATETLFFGALKSALGNCTVVSITHRLTTTESFDRVYRLESGELSVLADQRPEQARTEVAQRTAAATAADSTRRPAS